MSCTECVTGALHSGTPKGSETKVGGVDAYVVGDASSARVIVIGCDIFGWRFVNMRLLADEYAAHGFRVVVPDLFSGWELPTWTLNAHDPSNFRKSLVQRYLLAPLALFVLAPFVLRNLPHQVSLITSVLSALRSTPATPESASSPASTSGPEPASGARATGKVKKVGFVGFCWGGRFAISQNHLFDASVAAHPSLVRFPAELAGIRKPFSLAVAHDDPAFDRARAEETERILRESAGERGLGEGEVEVRVYEGVKHGWTTRANLEDARQREARDEAVRQVVGWFDRFL